MESGMPEVQVQLKNIENIMKAEQKRRVESNEIMNEYIINYLQQLQLNLNDRVGSQFSHLNHSIDAIDNIISKVEKEFELQHSNIK